MTVTERLIRHGGEFSEFTAADLPELSRIRTSLIFRGCYTFVVWGYRPAGPGTVMRMEKPQVVTAQEWELARTELLKAEKEATRTLDAIAARRRRLPMVRFAGDYAFAASGRSVSLLDLFDGRDQLAVYQFMDNGPGHFCAGCTAFTNNVPAHGLAILAENGISWATVSNMPLPQIEEYKARMGWALPFVSSHGTSFADDCGAGGGFMLTMFLRDGNEVYRTYSTTSRGVDRLLFSNNIRDLSAFGRQEDWEDSPAGWPQHPTYG